MEQLGFGLGVPCVGGTFWECHRCQCVQKQRRHLLAFQHRRPRCDPADSSHAASAKTADTSTTTPVDCKRHRRSCVAMQQRRDIDPDDLPETIGDEYPTDLTLSQELLMKSYIDQVERMSKPECDNLAMEILRQSYAKDNLLRMLGVKVPESMLRPPNPDLLFGADDSDDEDDGEGGRGRGRGRGGSSDGNSDGGGRGSGKKGGTGPLGDGGPGFAGSSR